MWPSAEVCQVLCIVSTLKLVALSQQLCEVISFVQAASAGRMHQDAAGPGEERKHNSVRVSKSSVCQPLGC